ncbi:phosphotransferase [Streptomyces yerevanensis]|uniref:phosphotransferase n=1 Tax=Streptomyces yerevanensis TaxID=66378 RepID=UPI00052490D2|nr:phosphotransferase [Streptomyces yerevanensis]
MNTSPPARTAQQLFEESGLASSHKPIETNVVDALLARHYQLSGHLERLATEKDDTFRLRTGTADHLVKVSPPDEAVAVVALQTAVMRHLETEAPHLPVQRVKATTEGSDDVPIETKGGGVRVLRVFDFVEGAVLARTKPDPHQLAQVGQMLGRVDLALRSFRHPADERRLVWDLRHFDQLRELIEYTPSATHRRLAQEVFRLFHEAVVPRLGDLETQVIHGDYSPYNVLVDPRPDSFVTGVIDFGDSMRSALIFDPAVSLANLLGRTPSDPWREAYSFVAGYERARPIKDTELPLLPVAALARLTLRALVTHWRAERVPERRDYLLEHARDDWVNVERATAVAMEEVVARLLSTRHDRP